MNYADDLAKELKKRNNVKRIGNLLGTVLSTSPIRIGILGNAAILDSSNSLLCRNATGLTIGNRVLVISDADGQFFYIVDKIV